MMKKINSSNIFLFHNKKSVQSSSNGCNSNASSAAASLEAASPVSCILNNGKVSEEWILQNKPKKTKQNFLKTFKTKIQSTISNKPNGNNNLKRKPNCSSDDLENRLDHSNNRKTLINSSGSNSRCLEPLSTSSPVSNSSPLPSSLYTLPEVVLSSNQSLDRASTALRLSHQLHHDSVYNCSTTNISPHNFNSHNASVDNCLINAARMNAQQLHCEGSPANQPWKYAKEDNDILGSMSPALDEESIERPESFNTIVMCSIDKSSSPSKSYENVIHPYYSEDLEDLITSKTLGITPVPKYTSKSSSRIIPGGNVHSILSLSSSSHLTDPSSSSFPQPSCQVYQMPSCYGDNSVLNIRSVVGPSQRTLSVVPALQPCSPVLPPIREDPIGGTDSEHGSDIGTFRSWSGELKDISHYGWYWGPISRHEAEKKLSGSTDGTFLVRDSSDVNYLLSLSFRSVGKTYHTRIEYRNGLFSFCPDSEHKGHSTVYDLITNCIANSSSGVFCYSKPRSATAPAFPVRLCTPLSRLSQVRSLQHLCRFVVHQHTRLDLIEELPVPPSIRAFLAGTPY